MAQIEVEVLVTKLDIFYFKKIKKKWGCLGLKHRENLDPCPLCLFSASSPSSLCRGPDQCRLPTSPLRWNPPSHSGETHQAPRTRTSSPAAHHCRLGLSGHIQVLSFSLTLLFYDLIHQTNLYCAKFLLGTPSLCSSMGIYHDFGDSGPGSLNSPDRLSRRFE